MLVCVWVSIISVLLMCQGTWLPCALTHWFKLDSAKRSNNNIDVLGTLKLDSTVAVLVRAEHTRSSTVFCAAPGLLVQLWRALAARASVHLFLESNFKVETANNRLSFH